jgi:hypothetical protein
MWRGVVPSSLRTTACTTVIMRRTFVMIVVGVVAPYPVKSGWKVCMEGTEVYFTLI